MVVLLCCYYSFIIYFCYKLVMLFLSFSVSLAFSGSILINHVYACSLTTAQTDGCVVAAVCCSSQKVSCSTWMRCGQRATAERQ